MTEGHLRSVARKWMEAGWRRPDAGAFRDLHARDFRDHSPAGRHPDREGFWEGVVSLLAAFPDFSAEVDDLILAPARGIVTIRWSALGTHRGLFLGCAPTGRTIRFSGIEIIRVEAGLVRERWGEWNEGELVEQMRRPEASPRPA